MPSTENLGLRFTRMLDANRAAREDFEEIFAQFRHWHHQEIESEPDEVKKCWLQGQLQQLTKLEIFLEACRERMASESIVLRDRVEP